MVNNDNSQTDQEKEQEAVLKKIRTGLGLSQTKMAASIDADPATVRRCELGFSEIRLTIAQFKKLFVLQGKTVINVDELPDYLGIPPENSN